MKCLTTKKASKTRQTKIIAPVASETIARIKRADKLRLLIQRRMTPLWRLKQPGKESKRLPCWLPGVRTQMTTIRFLERRRRGRIIRRALQLSSRKKAVIVGNEAVAKKVEGKVSSSRKQRLQMRKKKRRKR